MTQTRLVDFKIFLNSEKPVSVSIQEFKMNQEEGHLYLRFDGYVTSYKARKRRKVGLPHNWKTAVITIIPKKELNC